MTPSESKQHAMKECLSRLTSPPACVPAFRSVGMGNPTSMGAIRREVQAERSWPMLSEARGFSRSSNRGFAERGRRNDRVGKAVRRVDCATLAVGPPPSDAGRGHDAVTFSVGIDWWCFCIGDEPPLEVKPQLRQFGTYKIFELVPELVE